MQTEQQTVIQASTLAPAWKDIQYLIDELLGSHSCIGYKIITRYDAGVSVAIRISSPVLADEIVFSYTLHGNPNLLLFPWMEWSRSNDGKPQWLYVGHLRFCLRQLAMLAVNPFADKWSVDRMASSFIGYSPRDCIHPDSQIQAQARKSYEHNWAAEEALKRVVTSVMDVCSARKAANW